MLFAVANLTYWLFLGLGVVLFVLVIVAGGGGDDFDLEVGEGVDIDAGEFDFDVGEGDVAGGADAPDADAGEVGEGDVDGGNAGNPGLALLAAIGVGKAPLLLLLAIDFTLWGALGLLLNAIAFQGLGRVPERLFGLGGVIFVVSLVASLALGSIVARGFARVFASFSDDTRKDRLIGCSGTVSSALVPHDKLGQVDVIDAQGNRVTVSATLPPWATVTPVRGMRVLVIDVDERAYVAIAEESEDRDRWLAQGRART